MRSSSLGRVALVAMLTNGSVALAQSAQDLVQQGQQALSLGNYDQALIHYSTAYGSGGPKELLLDIGQIYIRLGQPNEARTACQTYLTQNPNPPPGKKAQAERCLSDAATTQTRPRVPPPLPKGTTAPERQAATTNNTINDPPPAPPPSYSPPPATRPTTTSTTTNTTTARKVATPAPVQNRPSPPPRQTTVAAAPPPPPPPEPIAAPPPPPPAPEPVYAPLPPPVETGAQSSPSPSPSNTTSSSNAATTATANLFSEYEKCLHEQRRGESNAARACYQRFLPEALRQGGVPESNIGQVTTQLTRFPEPAAVYTPAGKSDTPRRNNGLWGAGLTMWLAALIPTWIYGPKEASTTSGTRKTIYYTLMIPVLGPFISGIWLPVEAKAKAGDDIVITYTVPWIVADGLAQVAGLTMLAIGVQQRPLPARVARYLPDVRIAPYAGGSTFGVHGSF